MKLYNIREKNASVFFVFISNNLIIKFYITCKVDIYNLLVVKHGRLCYHFTDLLFD